MPEVQPECDRAISNAHEGLQLKHFQGVDGYGGLLLESWVQKKQKTGH